MSKRAYNFSAGPSALPFDVLTRIKGELFDWEKHGFSLMEMSHRHPDFIELTKKIEHDLRELMSIPSHYRVLFVSGGASFQFSGVALNLAGKNKCVDYFHTGLWSGKAIAEAHRYCDVNLVASAESTHFTAIPPEEEWKFSKNAAYVNYTPNETVHGLRFPSVPKTGKVPLVADMTSNILQECIDVNDFGVIYAGVQKNIALAGLSIVIVRDDLLNQAMDCCPSLLNYRMIDASASIPNTPPTFSWYVAGLMFEWLKKQGGVAAMEAKSRKRAEQLYMVIDHSSLYHNTVNIFYRSYINVPFQLADSTLDIRFLEEAHAANIVQLGGHATIGGMRASLYNGVEDAAVDVLIEFMRDFEKRCS